MAVVVQLCVGIYVAALLLDEEYTFVGVDIENDKKKLKHVGLVVQNFVISRICGECLIE